MGAGMRAAAERCAAAKALSVAALGVMCLWGAPALAGGYAQGTQGAASAGVAGAMTARPDSPEAGYYNPAGLALRPGWGAMVGTGAIFPTLFHVDPESGERTRAENDLAFVPHLHASWRPGERVGLGLSVGVPYGSSLRWPENWEGRFEAQAVSLRAFEAAPSLAIRPTRWLAFGAGPRVLLGSIGLERQIDVARSGEEARVQLSANAWGLGAQAGVWVAPTRRLSFGLSWRSTVRLNFSGIADFSDVPPELSEQARDTAFTTTIVLPDRIVLGGAWELGADAIVSLDVEYNRWSANEHFEVDFEDEQVDDINEARGWRDTFGMRVGVEYASPQGGLVMRSGFAIDPSPAPAEAISPAQPDTDRYIASLGVAYDVDDHLQVNLAYNYVILSQNAAGADAYPGIYDGFAHVLVLSLLAK
ncbi:hypothetical protein FRC96_21220 [Lujinxingia vulgaris]|uniref:Long-chain fatty acid transporter n=2 Tax=Lujinxingia vulgaris TaxID=2600176 RepID=A0A5C6X062_9DELT|nr:hypothetical protein FRC96_21220 [Lujinxingia vulgaris]